MLKSQFARVQREAPRRIAVRAVLAVAGDRMAERGQLHADLIPAPGFERELEQRSVSFCAQHAIMRDRQLAHLLRATDDPANHQRLVFDKPIPERPPARLRRPPDIS